MAPAEPASDASSAQSLTLPELIFSCGICQASVSEVYAQPESNKGFHSGSGDDDGIVTRLWIAECSHVTCGKHLAGGAAPFHPQGEQPQAPCPQCVRMGDDAPKNLYGIRGLDDGEHDPAIPQAWFQCPPIRLDGTAPGMDAVRFQFMALARYSQKVHGIWKTAKQEQAATEQGLNREHRKRRQLQAELDETRALSARDNVEMEQMRGVVQKWEGRVPIINELMSAVKPMADDLRQMRMRLLELGFEVPTRNYGFGDAQEITQKENVASHQLIGRNAQVIYDANGSSSSSRKRKRQEQDINVAHDEQDIQHVRRVSSRDMMPPPPAQKPPRHEVQSRPLMKKPPAFNVQQYHEPAYTHAAPGPRLRQATQQSSPGERRAGRTDEWATAGWSNHPTRLGTIPEDQPRNEYRYQLHKSNTHEPAGVSMGDNQYHGEYGISSGFGHRAPVNHQSHASRPPWLQRRPKESVTTLTRVKDSVPLDGPTHQYQPKPAREPLRQIFNYQGGPQTPLRPSYLDVDVQETAPSFGAPQPAAGAISSPFFQREANTSHFASMHRPPPRGGIISPTIAQHGHPSRSAVGSQPQRRQVSGRDISNSGNNPSQSAKPPLFDGFRAFGHPPTSATLPYRGNTVKTQALHDTRPSYERPTYVPASRHFTGNTHQTASPRGRITLPPSLSGTQDSELANIRGLRGGMPSHHNAGYNGSRPLFSAASRRSVRR